MKRILVWCLFAGSCIACARYAPGISILWQNWIALPLLKGFAWLGDRFSFVLLEVAAAALGVFLLIQLLRRRFLKSLCSAVLALASLYLLIWYPLYFADVPAYSANEAQLARICEALIDDLNAAQMDFSSVPALPAKFARRPGWMRALNLGGFASFFTGEAILSPELPEAAVPFIAMHERMHIQGIAGEGAANIAAWEACISAGGAYAASARIYALRCAMGMLRDARPELHSALLQRMNESTVFFYRACGGSYIPARRTGAAIAFQRLLGIETRAADYEILAAYLACSLSQ